MQEPVAADADESAFARSQLFHRWRRSWGVTLCCVALCGAVTLLVCMRTGDASREDVLVEQQLWGSDDAAGRGLMGQQRLYLSKREWSLLKRLKTKQHDLTSEIERAAAEVASVKRPPEIVHVRAKILHGFGKTGAAGPRGSQGPAGIVGRPGLRGHRGPRGIQGPRGHRGAAGQRGRTGKLEIKRVVHKVIQRIVKKVVVPKVVKKVIVKHKTVPKIVEKTVVKTKKVIVPKLVSKVVIKKVFVPKVVNHTVIKRVIVPKVVTKEVVKKVVVPKVVTKEVVKKVYVPKSEHVAQSRHAHKSIAAGLTPAQKWRQRRHDLLQSAEDPTQVVSRRTHKTVYAVGARTKLFGLRGRPRSLRACKLNHLHPSSARFEPVARFNGAASFNAVSGKWEFRVVSDDGCQFTINGDTVLDNDGVHRIQSKKGSRELHKGYHRFRLDYFQAEHHAALVLEARSPISRAWRVLKLYRRRRNSDVLKALQRKKEHSYQPGAVGKLYVSQHPEHQLTAIVSKQVKPSTRQLYRRLDLRSLMDFGLRQDVGFALEVTGYLHMENAGTWHFLTKFTGGVRIWVDGKEIISSGALSSERQRVGVASVTRGYKGIRIVYWKQGGSPHLALKMKGPSMTDYIIPRLFRRV